MKQNVNSGTSLGHLPYPVLGIQLGLRDDGQRRLFLLIRKAIFSLAICAFILSSNGSAASIPHTIVLNQTFGPAFNLPILFDDELLTSARRYKMVSLPGCVRVIRDR